MHAQIFLDPRIRDYVFIPLVFLIFSTQLLRILVMRYMNQPKNKLTDRARLAYSTLFGTIFEADADKERSMPEEPIDICKIIQEGADVDLSEMQALTRSKKIRKASKWLPDKAIKNRKAFYCNDQHGYFKKEVAAPNPMNMMQNPDMMNSMLKQNLQSVFYMFTFTAIGSVFQGFITAQVPFPLGFKFKQMLQQGLSVVALDPTYVSSMSWAILCIYGLSGIIGLLLKDSKSVEELELMASGAGAIQQQQQSMQQQKNYVALFKAEKDFYEIMTYEHYLNEIEDAFLVRHKKELYKKKK